ncbi:GspE/PulE family protein [Sansalvadorimonas sp. 2012CJ34-2]|uniref:GspE/PulE family protein n=1 Tax=Parendozoicomonas callyspongiae TaxID=2942213 RepID=A0ABT0PDD8_9GAMM|nr:GspE/PulE family protein [Sansalvadorimonas sp. 2012CJ34-2]MCL6269236.1 GspE/PulE family protein [Sansalvadorimonas sp. 2012CJ34-2]
MGLSNREKSAGYMLDLSQLVKHLVRDGLLSEKQSEEVLSQRRDAQQARQHPLEYLAGLKLKDARHTDKTLDLETLTHWLADDAGQPYFHIDPLKIDTASVTPVMSQAFAQRHQILAVDVNDREVVVASSQPWHTGWEENLRHVCQREVRRVVCNPTDLTRYTAEFYKLAKSITGASKTDGVKTAVTNNFEQMLELGNAQAPDVNDQHIVNIVDWLLQYAFEQRASDIHIEPRRDQGHIRFRIDGVLHTVYDMPSQVVAAVTSRIKIMGRMNVAEKRRPQDGRLKTRSEEGNEIELRLSTLPTAFGEKMVMRIFDPDVLLKSFGELGFSKEDDSRWHQMVKQSNGIVLVTGPTGSGKTTTLYSTLKELATDEVNVCTIEDPIEMVESSFNQMQVQHNIDLNFASGVRALMRQDPDIIMIGEIRDLETAEMAIQAALTGHLVLSTLHTNDAPSAITRLLELGVPHYLIRATVLGVMAQRLVRTLCPECKKPASVDEKSWGELTRPWVAESPKQIARPVGCQACRQTGYLGRTGVYELMLLEGTTRDLISDQCDLDKLRASAIKEGMHTLRLSGAQKVAAGLTTMEEVLRVTPVTVTR